MERAQNESRGVTVLAEHGEGRRVVQEAAEHDREALERGGVFLEPGAIALDPRHDESLAVLAKDCPRTVLDKVRSLEIAHLQKKLDLGPVVGRHFGARRTAEWTLQIGEKKS